MPIETGSFISSLNPANPPSNDPKSEGDNHLRFIKEKIVETFPNIDGAVTASPGELNILDGATLDTAELNVLDGVTATTEEINLLDGVTSTTDEINSIHLKANIDSPTLTGTPRAPTGAAGSGGTQIATHDYVNSTILNVSLPGQAGNAGALMSTDGTNANWTKTISGITINQTDSQFTLQDNVDPTKKAQFECSGITTGTTRVITFPDENVTLGDSPIKLLQTFNLNAGSSIWEILPTIIDNRFDTYEFEFYGLTITNAGTLSMQLKAGGAYLVTNYASGSNFVNASVPIVSSMTSGAPNYAAGRITFYLPWNTSLRKYGHYLTHEANFSNVGIVMKMVNTSLLALEGFKLYPATGTINAGAVGKWYGLK